jgi:formylglycine-generating enzyme required for sulfatase activity
MFFQSKFVRWRLLFFVVALLGLAIYKVGSFHSTNSSMIESPKEDISSCQSLEKLNQQHDGMVWVPGGLAQLGDDVYLEESKSKKNVPGFWIDSHEVTNLEFMEFVNATNYQTLAEQFHNKVNPSLDPHVAVFIFPNAKTQDLGGWKFDLSADWRHPGGKNTTIEGKGNFPVTAITFQDAKAYADWKGHLLPSEAEWEWAARGATNKSVQAEENHHQPEANQANTFQGIFPIRNTANDGFVGLAPIACFAPNPLGIYDMIGNAWEFTRDNWSAAHIQQTNEQSSLDYPKRDYLAKQKVIKGGSFLCSSDFCMRYRPGSRAAQDEDLGASHLGFRTIKYK